MQAQEFDTIDTAMPRMAVRRRALFTVPRAVAGRQVAEPAMPNAKPQVSAAFME